MRREVQRSIVHHGQLATNLDNLHAVDGPTNEGAQGFPGASVRPERTNVMGMMRHRQLMAKATTSLVTSCSSY
jgi:hypothetical protein